MERTNSQKSTYKSEFFEFFIEKYEEDVENESSNERKNEILDLLKNYNKFGSDKEIQEIRYFLHIACKECDVDLVKIYLSKTVENNSNGLQFKIDETYQTASLFKVNIGINEVIVPRTIEHESVEYLITSISGTSSQIKTLKFVEDSAVKTFYKHSFGVSSDIEEICFPNSLEELKEGWCRGTNNLTKITLSPTTGQFRIEDDEYLIGKSDSNKDEFDILQLAFRDIKEIFIQSNIFIQSKSFQLIHSTTVKI